MWEFAHLRIPWKTVEYFWTFLIRDSYNSLRTREKEKGNEGCHCSTVTEQLK